MSEVRQNGRPVDERLKEIKQSFRLMMNGVTAQSMRDKGAVYHVNWGAPLPMLKEMAARIGHDYGLAIALWKENVRECKVLATMVMPPERMLPEVADIWMEQTETQEMAELAAFNLYRYLPYAADLAFRWIATDRELYQLCGFNVLGRLFMDGREPNERAINELVDQAQAALQGPSVAVRKAALSCMNHFADMGLVYERLAKSALKRAGVDFF